MPNTKQPDMRYNDSGYNDSTAYEALKNVQKEERRKLIEKVFADTPNIVVDDDDGLLADYAKKVNATAIVKGLRAMSDFEYEFQMALTNKKLNPALETVFLTSSAENMYLSSSIVRQVASFDGDISAFVPEEILSDVENVLKLK